MAFENVFTPRTVRKMKDDVAISVWVNGQCRIDKTILGDLDRVSMEIDIDNRRVRVRATPDGDRRVTSINRVHLPKQFCYELVGEEFKRVILLEEEVDESSGEPVKWYSGKY